MSGYQSLHNLIADHAGQDLNTNQIEGLANAIITEWMPAEAEAVIEAKQQAEKQKKQLEKVRTDNQQAIMTSDASNISERDFSKLVGEF